MIALPAGTQVWLAAGETDLRKGFDGLAALVQVQLAEDPFSGQLYVFRGRRGDRIKILWWSGDGLCLFAKRLERGKFVWPQATSGTVSLTGAQLSMLLEGIDWRRPDTHLRSAARCIKSACFVVFCACAGTYAQYNAPCPKQPHCQTTLKPSRSCWSSAARRSRPQRHW